MSATTRWVQYDVSSVGSVAPTFSGSRGYHTATEASDTDSFTINSSNNMLYVNLGDGVSSITIASGIDLDPRFVARDITEKIRVLGGNTDYNYKNAQCVWENNQLKLYCGDTGAGTVATVSSGTNTAHIHLGWTGTGVGGSDNNPATTSGNNYTGGVTISGTYNGFFDEVYTVVISKDWTVGAASHPTGSYNGTITTGGVYNNSINDTYSLTIDITNGTTMAGGTGNVPILEWTSTQGDDSPAGGVELLYPNHFYRVGTKGVMVKFTDAVFYSNDTWTIACTAPTHAQGLNVSALRGTAKYIYGSTRGDDSNVSLDTSSGGFTKLGERGLSIRFDNDILLRARDQFSIICSPPLPYARDISNLNFGNVTVSTESSVKVVMFEILSGAAEISTVKFGLQSHGSFQHHEENNSNTYFRFGTVGPGNVASGSTSYEWYANVAASNLAAVSTPTFLYANKANLSVVSDADDSEVVGSSGFMGMTSDPIWLNIKLGNSETGANSTINYRIYFDYL